MTDQNLDDSQTSQPEAGPSGPSIPAVPAAPSNRSIFSYFSNGISAASTPPISTGPSVGAQPQQKRKRRKQEELENQARFKVNGTGWALGRVDPIVVNTGAADVEVPASKVKTKARKSDDGESAELKEMSRKTTAVKQQEGRVTIGAGKGKGRGKRKSGAEAETGENQDIEMDGSQLSGAANPDSSTIPGDLSGNLSTDDRASNASQPLPSPIKRRKGRTRKSDPANQPSPVPTIVSPSNIVNLVSSDPVEPPRISHRQSSPSDIIITGHNLKPGRPLPMSRTQSASSKGNIGTSQTDPINVDEVVLPKAPKKTVFASDLKPTHSFFSKGSASNGGTRASSVLSDAAGSEVSTATKVAKGKAKAVHSFFQQNGAEGKPGVEKNGWGRGFKEGEEMLALWPGRLFPSHVSDAEQTWAVQGGIKRRGVTLPDLEEDMDTFFASHFRGKSSPQAADNEADRRDQIPHNAAAARSPSTPSKSKTMSNANRETWCEKYRPKRAKDVLGNETEATYLRDWLSALTIGVKEGNLPRVVRKVRKAKAQAYDGWIVDDIGLFGDAQDEDEDNPEDDFVEIEGPPLPFGPRPTFYPDFSSRLANTILLTGPNGCGKSASVYAAATELGWDVFEVYPGIGKRTGANLMSLVGDVGKNHTVIQSKEVKSPAIKRFFGGAKSKQKEMDLDEEITLPGSQEAPIDVENGHGNDHDDSEVAHGDESKFRQSLILLDEVDILYDQEDTFWGAVRALIAESRRPVVLTCNDPERIPLATLPLQTILQFEAPTIDEAASYLEEIVDQELRSPCDVRGLLEMQQRTLSNGLLDQPLPPNGHEPLPTIDMRQAIMQLQVDRSRTLSREKEVDDYNPDLTTLRTELERQSMVDASIARRSNGLLDAIEVDRHAATVDDLLDVNQLLKSELPDWYPIIPAYDRSEEIAAALSSNMDSDRMISDLQIARTTYIRSLLPILDPLIPLNSYLLPHPSLFLDYMPTIHNIVRADDMLQEAEEAVIAEGGERINRKTGRSIRYIAGKDEGYQRYLKDLDEHALELARRSELIYVE